ncbi:hypothetical protein [Chelatococcus sp. XZ-Ab1]|uniref:hypothetical protein n=1 Tax=Chelatococcus sp. XZ-Ab1 TaxID=3034027 RepID=UPI0023E3D41C|nr:hypothetical protein [Chelatococcus sp. XZ-Ab1]
MSGGERDLRKRVAALERRLGALLLVGTVEETRGAQVKVRFDDEGAAGGPFVSPFLAQAASAGKNGQGVSRYTRMGKGEPAIVMSPGGEIGAHSRVLPGGHVEDFPSPGSAEEHGEIITIGNATIAIKDGEIQLQVADTVFVVTTERIELKRGASSFVLTDAAVTLTARQFRGVKA